MPHESTVDHDGSELSADEADSPMTLTVDTVAAAASLRSFLSPASQAPHVPHVRPVMPKEVTHHHDDDDDDDDDIDVDSADNVADDNEVIVNGNVNN